MIFVLPQVSAAGLDRTDRVHYRERPVRPRDAPANRVKWDPRSGLASVPNGIRGVKATLMETSRDRNRHRSRRPGDGARLSQACGRTLSIRVPRHGSPSPAGSSWSMRSVSGTTAHGLWRSDGGVVEAIQKLKGRLDSRNRESERASFAEAPCREKLWAGLRFRSGLLGRAAGWAGTSGRRCGITDPMVTGSCPKAGSGATGALALSVLSTKATCDRHTGPADRHR